MASESACEKPLPPQLLLLATMLMPESFSDFTISRQVIAPPKSPKPCELMNLQGRIWIFQLIPATPTALFVAAPVIPATWVPCPRSSRGSQLPSTALNPCDPAGQVNTSPCVRVTVNDEEALQICEERSGCV